MTAPFILTLALLLTGGGWPLDPRPPVQRGFDPPAQTWLPGHRGVDLLGRPGQPVLAAAGGEVSFAGRVAGRGVVVVRHGATRSTYQPVAATVRRGDRVRAGDVLGLLAVAGSHCLPLACLHWGLRRGDVYLDPLTLVGGGPVRLLPWQDVGPLPLLPPAGSSPGVRLPVGLPEPVGGDVGVELGGRQ